MSRRLAALRRFGQHFLVDPNIQRKMLSCLDLARRDVVLEIGPGDGALTRPVMERVRRVVAVEIDRGRAAGLKASVPQRSRLTVLCRDILKTDLESIARRHHAGRLVVLGNIPYNITSPILQLLCAAAPFVKAAYLTVQKEVAGRLTARPGSKAYGSLTCFVRYHFSVKALFDVRPGSFRPRPKVTSTFICLMPQGPGVRGVKSSRLLFQVIRAGFGQRRKRLAKALKAFLPAELLSSARAEKYLGRRAEEMSLDDFEELANLIFDIQRRR